MTVKKKSLFWGMLRGEVKITPDDVMAFEDRANRLQYEAGQARMKANTINDLYVEQGGMLDDNFFKRKDYRDTLDRYNALCYTRTRSSSCREW